MTAATGGPTPIRDMFEGLVPGYDRFNALSSLGLDAVWRKKAARQFEPGSSVLDVGCGTGELARALAQHGCRVTGVDLAEGMIDAARKKFSQHPDVVFSVGRADHISFPDHSFDGVTSAFVLRNLNQGGVLAASFREFHRVLKPGKRTVHLELTRPASPVLLWGHQLYLRTVLPFIGRMMFAGRWPQNYLASTIRNFPSPDEVCRMLKEAGFSRAWSLPLTGGVVSLIIGERN